MGRRLVVVGAGPTGIAAALGAVRRGFDVTVLERDQVGASLRAWGDVRFFSTLEMNVSADMVEALGTALPPRDALLTGPAFVDRVLDPIAATALAGRIRTGHRVVAIGRAGLCRGDFAGHPLRAERALRLVVESAEGEAWLDADAVIDASGVYRNPVWLGAGGLPAPGERAAGAAVLRDLGALHAALPSLVGSRLLLVGHGHSATHALACCRGLAERGTTVTWATRAPNLRPVTDVALDPLPERHRIVAEANLLASKPPPWLTVERRCHVEALTPNGEAFTVQLSGGRQVTVDRVVAMLGFRPDLSFLSELAIEIAPATEGAGGLARALANVTDCLAVPRITPRDLASGEPGFHLAGAKSYGRARTFLLRTGYAQLEAMLDGLA